MSRASARAVFPEPVADDDGAPRSSVATASDPTGGRPSEPSLALEHPSLSVTEDELFAAGNTSVNPTSANDGVRDEDKANAVTEEPPQAAPPQQRRFQRGLRRLRDRVQAQEDRLRLDVNSLKQDINDLNVQRLVLNTKHAVQRRLLQQKAVEVVVEYFGAFQHGWIAEDAKATDEELCCTSDKSELKMARSPRQPSEQAAFLRQRQKLLIDRQRHFVATALAPIMICGSAETNGADAFVVEWKTYSELHRLARLTLKYMTCHGSADEPIIIATGTFSGTLTHQALEQKYPHALSDPRLGKKLVGTAIRYPSREVFYFSNVGLITRYDRGLDYVRAFASILRSLDDVAVVLEDAELWDVDATDDDASAKEAIETANEVSLGPTTSASEEKDGVQ